MTSRSVDDGAGMSRVGLAAARARGEEDSMEGSDAAFDALVTYLKIERGFDFSGYKRPSLERRVRRQMQLVGASTYEDYVDLLQVRPEEFTALFNMILINVTGFFRDPDAWEELRSVVVPALLRDRPSGPLRLWSAGCASGEEAFSLAICFAEALGAEEFRSRVKIYATDVDEEALAQARHAIYDAASLAGLPDGLAERYFEPVHGGERMAFRKDLRRCVIFGRNDLVQDAPISRIDLLACRNTLMYFNSEQQARIVQRLHFALSPTGVLFIGKAETLWGHTALFQATDTTRRFFRKMPVEPPRDRLLDPATGLLAARDWDRVDAVKLREQALLSSSVAHVVIDREGNLALANHRAEALFHLGARDVGRPFQDLELSYRPLEIRSHVEQALTERHPLVLRDVEWIRAGSEQTYVEIEIVPLLDPTGDDVFGVSLFFTDVTAYRRLQLELEYANRQLETAYEQLHSTNEELETTNEELQSTVEELETTNEELQSTNEELETMNEELQSMNDELHGSNEELRLRTVEVGEVNAFMAAVLSGLRAAVLVVDAEQRVLVWNRQAEDLWGVRREEAVGRHLLGLDIGLPLERLTPVLRAVLDGRQPGEAQDLHLPTLTRRGRTLQVRVSATPLRRDDGAVTGAILVVDEA